MRSLRRFGLALLVVGCAMSVEGRATADPAAAEACTVPAKERARDLVVAATDAAAAGRWDEAEALVKTAWDLEKTFDIAGNLGDIELKNGKPRDAAEHLRESLKMLPPTVLAAQGERVRERFEEARAQIAALKIRVRPEGASVLVDRKPVGSAPLGDEVLVDPGEHWVTAELEGYEKVSQVVRVAKGDGVDVTLELRPKAAPPVTLRAIPKVAPAGSATALRATPPGAAKSSEPQGARPSIVALGGALVVVGAAVGVGLEANASAKSESADQMKNALDVRFGPTACFDEPAAAEDCKKLRSTLETLDALRLGSRIGFGMAGTALALSLAYVLQGSRSQGAEGATKVVPSVTANAGSLVVMGVW